MSLGRSWVPIVLAALCTEAIPAARAQTHNYFASSGSITGSSWSTNPAGPFSSPFNTTGGGIMNFNNPTSSVTGGNLTVAGINATANVSNWSAGAGSTITNFGGGTITIHVASGATLDFGTVQMFGSSNNLVAVTSGLIKDGGGTVGLAGGYYTGGFTLNAGTVVAYNAVSLGSTATGGGTAGNLTINGGTIAANAFRDFSGKFLTILAQANFQVGAQTNHVSIASTTAGMSFDAPMNLGSSGTRTITIGGSGTYSFLGSVTNSVGASGLRIEAANAAGYQNTRVSGLVVFGGNNISFTGTTTIASGRVQFTSTSAVPGVGANVVVGNGATFAATGLSQTYLNRISNPTGSFVLALGSNTANNLNFTSFTNASLGAVGAFTYLGTITPSGGTYRLGGGGGALTVGTTGVANLTGSNSVLITANGSTGISTVTYGEAMTYSGTTTIANGGIYLAPTVANLANVPGTGQNIQVNAGGSLAASGTSGDALAQAHLSRVSTSSAGVVALGSNSANGLNFSGSGANLNNVSLGAIGSFTYSGILVPASSTFRLGGGGGSLTVTTVLAGAGNSLVISTNGTAETSSVILPVANTYGGTTTINSGSLFVGNNASLSSGTFHLAGGNVVNTATPITLANNIVAAAGTTTNVISNNSSSNTLTLSGAITGTGTILSAPVPGNNSALLISGNISGFAGTFRLTGTNAINLMVFNHNTDTNNWNGSQASFVADGSGHQFRWGGTTGNTTMRMGALSGTGTGVVVQPVNSASASTALLEVGALNTNTSLAGSIADNTNVVLSLTKVGTGSLNLQAASTYSGATTISAGTLFVNNATGSATGTGNVVVNANGTLGGSGIIIPGTGKSVTVHGKIAPGNSTGNLTFGSDTQSTNVTLNGTYEFDLTAAGLANPGTAGGSSPTATHDRITVFGNLNLNGMTININSIGTTGFDSTQDYSWTIATATGTVTTTGTLSIGTLSGPSFSSLPSAAFSLTADSNNVYLNYSASAVPEPGTILACASLLLGGGHRLRRRMRR